MPRWIRRLFVIPATLALALVAMVPVAAQEEGTPYSGELPNGTTWIAEVPANWNGTLLLYSHGYIPAFVPIPNSPAYAPNQATADALLAEGYALAGSSYAATGWALPTAPTDQLDTLTAVTDAIGAAPSRVIAYGTSMGGLVTAKLAETAGDRIDGALPTCGIVGGGLALNNYQLDGGHAIDRLLAPSVDIPLANFASTGEAFAATAAMTAAVNAAQATAEGRARIALVSALYQLPYWRPGTPKPAPGDWDAIQQGQYEWLAATLGFVVPGRTDLEAAVDGNSSWNIGVDYKNLLRESPDRSEVKALYVAAGLDLDADLAQLTSTADIAADAGAVDAMTETSKPTGSLQMPVLSIHTTHDNLVPVQHERGYADLVVAAGDRDLLTQAYVDRPGHCSFTPAELVAAVHAIDERVATGRWSINASVRGLQREAESLGLGEAAFVGYPFTGGFLGDRTDAAIGMNIAS